MDFPKYCYFRMCKYLSVCQILELAKVSKRANAACLSALVWKDKFEEAYTYIQKCWNEYDDKKRTIEFLKQNEILFEGHMHPYDKYVKMIDDFRSLRIIITVGYDQCIYRLMHLDNRPGDCICQPYGKNGMISYPEKDHYPIRYQWRVKEYLRQHYPEYIRSGENYLSIDWEKVNNYADFIKAVSEAKRYIVENNIIS